jgi:exoribonuclease R
LKDISEDRKKTIYKPYLNDKSLIENQLKTGELFKGIFKINPKFRNRAFVQVPELKLDVFIEDHIKMNRALDGDVVLIKLDKSQTWKEAQNQKQKQGKVIIGYSNEQGIELNKKDKKMESEDS